MMLKEYQKQALAEVRQFLEHLETWRGRVLAMDPEQTMDWIAPAWREAGKADVPVPRRNGLNHPLPCYCLKVPTGGGKTLLAVKVIDLVNHHFRRQSTGLVLWVVPTTQIYNQTLAALKDRDHPYRQQLDLASANRTVVLEKTDRFRPEDVAENLCVMLLMLPSANRETKEQLRMFRDSGGFDAFFPTEDDNEGHDALLAKFPNLNAFDPVGGWNRQAKTSLGNTLRTLAPLIILDEGHKAYSRGAKETLEGFNPCMIVELSATPPKGANVLVEITGQALLREEMVKLDLNIFNKESPSWQDTLIAAVEHRNALEAKALEYEDETGDYIRPICVIQVERTGRDQRGAGFIHADDARDYLLTHPGIKPEHIAVKTSGRDDLKEVDEVGGLLSRDCPIRFIVTKQALQEGWDCSFAYVLAILANPSAKTALTQLVGRILRQPFARKTHVRELDESYVYAFQRRGQDLLQEVRRGFGLEGLQGLDPKLVDEVGGKGSRELVPATPRRRFRQAAKNLVLPAFMVKEGSSGASGEWRLVDFEEDILSRVRWQDMNPSPLFDLKLGDTGRRELALKAGLDVEPLFEDVDAHGLPVKEGVIDLYFAASHLADIVPNPWRAAGLAKDVFDALLEKHSQDRVGANYLFVLEELRKELSLQRDTLCQEAFRQLLASGEMRFIVVAKDLGFNKLPTKIETVITRQANREDGKPFQANLFSEMDESELNGLENKVATYLDKQARLFFWYRNRARRDYFVQGWKPGKIYADFIMTLKPDDQEANDEYHQVFVVETKGIHLERSADTDYKRSVFDICNDYAKRADWAEFVPAMQRKAVRFEIVDEEEWERKLGDVLAG